MAPVIASRVDFGGHLIILLLDLSLAMLNLAETAVAFTISILVVAVSLGWAIFVTWMALGKNNRDFRIALVPRNPG